MTFLEKKHNITKVEEVDKNVIKKYISYLNTNNHKASYVFSIIKANKIFFKYLVEEEFIDASPFNNIKTPRNDITLILTFNDEEVKRMLSIKTSNHKYINERNKTILIMLIETGIRNFELCNLQTSDIRNNTLRIFGKGNKERYVGITPELFKQMGRYERVKSNYMSDKVAKCDNYFVSQSQRPLTIEMIEKIIRKVGELAKVRDEIRCSPHTFRHYFAQTQIKNGLDVFSLSRILGHSNISITHRYLQSMSNDDILQKSILTSPLRNI